MSEENKVHPLDEFKEDPNNDIREFIRIENLQNVIIAIGKKLKSNEFFEVATDPRELRRYVNGYLRPNLFCVVEYPYVDRMYRDTYYHFHSTKMSRQNKDCIRVSLFEETVTKYDFFPESEKDEEKIEALKNQYLGYLIIRPTKIKKVGRTFLSKRALLNNNFECCLTSSKAFVNGVEFNVVGFPHATQDNETHKCAEICIWETMEYFSKYPEFHTVLPSAITAAADDLNYQRAMPSEGLIFNQMSYALKKFGFGVKAYNLEYRTADDFKRVFNDYVESGIPVLTIVKNNKEVHHSILAIGHEKILPKMLNKNEIDDAFKSADTVIKIIDSSNFYNKKYIFIDDNLPPYQRASFENPLAHYEDPKGARIVSFIIPLQSKIYIDSIRVRQIFTSLMSKGLLTEKMNSEGAGVFVSRFLLTSTRSFKRTLSGDYNIDLRLRIWLETLSLPRFVWLIELSSVDKYLTNRSLGFIIIDATGSAHIDSIVAIVWKDTVTIRTDDGFFREKGSLTNQDYPLFTGNLN